MPAILVLIAPLVTLYIKFKLASLVFRIVVFDLIYITLTNLTNELVGTVFSKIISINLPCGFAWILADLNLVGCLSVYLNIILSAMSLRLIFALSVRAIK